MGGISIRAPPPGVERDVPGPPRERRFASGLVRRGPGPRGRRIYSRGEPGPRGSKLSANNLFFFEVSDSDLRLSRLLPNSEMR